MEDSTVWWILIGLTFVAIGGLIGLEEMNQNKPDWFINFYFSFTLVASFYISLELIGTWWLQVVWWIVYLLFGGVCGKIVHRFLKSS